MNHLKRNLLFGAGLSLLGMIGTAGAQEPGTQPATPRPQGAAPGPKPPMPTAQQHQKPGPGPGGPGAKGRSSPTGPSASENQTGGPRPVPGARPGAGPRPNMEERMAKAHGPMTPSSRRAQDRAARELRQAERSYFTSQKLRMQGGKDAEAELKKAEQAQKSAEKRALKQLARVQQARVRARRPMTPDELRVLQGKLDEAAQKRAKDRGERRDKWQAELKAAYGKKLEKPAVQAELRRHAWRVARLERLIDMADAMGKAQLVTQATGLLEKEKEMHQGRLKAFAADKMPELPPGLEEEEPTSGAGKTNAAPAKKDAAKKDPAKKPAAAPTGAALPASKEGAQ